MIYTIEYMNIQITGVKDMTDFGARLGGLLVGGVIIELVGDVGAGKTTLAKGIALGLGIDEDVQSPSFTISRVYTGREGLRMAHYDFYRLNDPGIMKAELAEVVADPQTITLIEWAELVGDTLPADRLTIRITPITETERQLDITSGGSRAQWVEKQL